MHGRLARGEDHGQDAIPRAHDASGTCGTALSPRNQRHRPDSVNRNLSSQAAARSWRSAPAWAAENGARTASETPPHPASDPVLTSSRWGHTISADGWGEKQGLSESPSIGSAKGEGCLTLLSCQNFLEHVPETGFFLDSISGGASEKIMKEKGAAGEPVRMRRERRGAETQKSRASYQPLSQNDVRKIADAALDF